MMIVASLSVGIKFHLEKQVVCFTLVVLVGMNLVREFALFFVDFVSNKRKELAREHRSVSDLAIHLKDNFRMVALLLKKVRKYLISLGTLRFV
jgi:hypothetical protein